MKKWSHLNLTYDLAVGPAAVDGGYEAEGGNQESDRQVVARQTRQQITRLRGGGAIRPETHGTRYFIAFFSLYLLSFFLHKERE